MWRKMGSLHQATASCVRLCWPCHGPWESSPFPGEGATWLQDRLRFVWTQSDKGCHREKGRQKLLHVLPSSLWLPSHRHSECRVHPEPLTIVPAWRLGTTWSHKYDLSPGSAAYSDLPATSGKPNLPISSTFCSFQTSAQYHVVTELRNHGRRFSPAPGKGQTVLRAAVSLGAAEPLTRQPPHWVCAPGSRRRRASLAFLQEALQGVCLHGRRRVTGITDAIRGLRMFSFLFLLMKS